MPRISVVVPSFNAEKHIAETLGSLLDQTADFEILLLDDASRDRTVERARALNNARIRIFPLEHSQGRAANANRAFDLCRGDYIARIDHDVIAEPGRLAKQAAFLDARPDIAVVGSQVRRAGEQHHVSDFPLDDARIKARFLAGTRYLAHSGVMFRRAFVQRFNLRYDPNLDIFDDLGFWFDCMLHGARFANLPEPLTAYRGHPAAALPNPNATRLFEGKRRLYKRVLQAFYPKLNSHDIERLLKLWECPRHPEPDFDALIALHRSVGVAISEIDMRWNASREELEGRLLGMLAEALTERDRVYPRSRAQAAHCHDALLEGAGLRHAESVAQ
jgi:glycosyltransferase involved in cell wall biosynthesis